MTTIFSPVISPINGALINDVANFTQSTIPTTRIGGGALVAGDLFYSTVENLKYYWNGALWLTVNDFQVVVGRGLIFGWAENSPLPRKANHGIYIVDGWLTGQSFGTGSDNGASNFWLGTITNTALNINITITTVSLGILANNVQFATSGSFNTVLPKTQDTVWIGFTTSGTPKNIERASFSVRIRYYL